jgi:hypothetical protein
MVKRRISWNEAQLRYICFMVAKAPQDLADEQVAAFSAQISQSSPGNDTQEAHTWFHNRLVPNPKRNPLPDDTADEHRLRAAVAIDDNNVRTDNLGPQSHEQQIKIDIRIGMPTPGRPGAANLFYLRQASKNSHL